MAKPGRQPLHLVVEESVQSLLQVAGLPLPDAWRSPPDGVYAQMIGKPYDAAYTLPDGRKVGYRQFRYVLGDGRDFFGVWDQMAPSDGPVMTTPKRPGGWREARRAWADFMNRLPPDESLVT